MPQQPNGINCISGIDSSRNNENNEDTIANDGRGGDQSDNDNDRQWTAQSQFDQHFYSTISSQEEEHFCEILVSQFYFYNNPSELYFAIISEFALENYPKFSAFIHPCIKENYNS